MTELFSGPDGPKVVAQIEMKGKRARAYIKNPSTLLLCLRVISRGLNEVSSQSLSDVIGLKLRLIFGSDINLYLRHVLHQILSATKFP